MASRRAPKQRVLTKDETITSFEAWRQNLTYILSQDENFAPFLQSEATWLKKSRENPNRGLVEEDGHTAAQRVVFLELMLGQIANFCPVVARSSIVQKSVSISSVWQTIRSHFGFQNSGAQFLDVCDFKLETDERPEDLYQRLVAFFDDNLLTPNCGITHHGDPVVEEEIAPSLENMITVLWLQLINPSLPKLVKQRYGTQLRSCTVASLKPDISQSMSSLIEELETHEEVRCMRMGTKHTYHHSFATNKPYKSVPAKPIRNKKCPLCSQAKRPSVDHYLSMCPYLPETDKKFMTRARQIIVESDNEESTDPVTTDASVSSRRVQVDQSPYIDTFYSHHPVRVTVDSGSETNMISHALVIRLGLPIKKSTQHATQADGQTKLTVVGETQFELTRGLHNLHLTALVVESMDVELLGGTPFMSVNDVSVRPAKQHVMINDEVYPYGPSKDLSLPRVRRTQASLLRCASRTTVWPEKFLEVNLPHEIDTVHTLAVEPRPDLYTHHDDTSWLQPEILQSVDGKIRIPNCTDLPVVVRRHSHLSQAIPVYTPDDTDTMPQTNTNTIACPPKDPLSSISLDPDHTLSPHLRNDFTSLLQKYEDVFSLAPKGYNGAFGPFTAKVNMGPVLPPQRKGRVPQYSKDKLNELQSKFDELEALGVFRRPEDLNLTVEYLNPSFLIKKPNGSFRLVTAFGEVGKYSKPQPSLMPDTDSILRSIARWNFIIATDLSNAFYQIPLSPESMKYCGVATPFKGIRVYTRCAMGMPGSETALEELMCRVLGDYIQEGFVAKIADDLYCGGDTPEKLLHNWEKVLQALRSASLSLKASKTVIAPKKTTILGWLWCQGTLSATPHRITALSTCNLPKTIKDLRAFIGAYKFLSRVLPQCASLLSPLDAITAGSQSTDIISWTDESTQAFLNAQTYLRDSKTITLPKSSDQLWIVTDGAVKSSGLASTLYVLRNDKLLLSGFYSTKLPARKHGWTPCEIEALSIAASIKHFAPYIIQSDAVTQLLTDSKPCVEAYSKLQRGEYSNSPRVATFLSIASRYQVAIRHLAGAVNIPSDFASRNAQECLEPSCQVCSFVHSLMESVVRAVTVKDLLSGSVKLPFLNRTLWRHAQQDCPDLRRVHSHLTQGTRPSKKATNIKDVKRYLNNVTIAPDGTLVVKKTDPLSPTRDLIVIPRELLQGLLTALHIRLDHPSAYQLRQVVKRYLYALDIDQSIAIVTNYCQQCAALRKVPSNLTKQSTDEPPITVGSHFAADVLCRAKQKILVLRECVTSRTVATLVCDETHKTIRDSLIQLCIEMIPIEGHCIIRCDPAPCFQAMANDTKLKQLGIHVELGRTKNINKNPVAEHAIQEVEDEILRQDPSGNKVTPVLLSCVIARINSRIRGSGLSAREMWCKRDQVSNQQLPVDDQNLIASQHRRRIKNHPFSERSKNPHDKPCPKPEIHVGDLVYLYCDRDKNRARDTYIVTESHGDILGVHKLKNNQIRSKLYKVKLSEVYKPQSLIDTESSSSDDSADELSVIPRTLTEPLTVSDPEDTHTAEPASSDDQTQTVLSQRRRQRPKHFDDFLLY